MSRKTRRNKARQQESQTVDNRPLMVRHLEAWGDFVDPLDFIRDEPFSWAMTGNGGAPWFGYNSRQHGRNLPFIYTEQDLLAHRQLARFICGYTIQGISILENLENWIIGKGLQPTVVAKKGVNPPDGILAAAQSEIDQFYDYNDWQNDLDRELLRREVRDGESFLALFDEGGGRVAARIVEPEQVRDPLGFGREIEQTYGFDHFASDWSFGIHTPENDIQKTLGYYVLWNSAGTDWSYLTTQVMGHAKRNVDRNVKRGMSDFFAVNDDIMHTDKLVNNMRVGASVQAAIPFIRQHAAGTTTQQVSDFQSRQTQQVKQPLIGRSGPQRNIAQYQPGTVLDIGRGMEYKEPPFNGEAGRVFLEIAQGCLRLIGSRWQMPEYMISGDASNGNYASTMVAESPFVKKCEHEQEKTAAKHRKLLFKVLAMKCAAGRFRKFGIVSPDDLAMMLDIKIKSPRVAARDEDKQTESNEKKYNAGLISMETWAADEGHDFDHEQEKIASEREKGIAPQPKQSQFPGGGLFESKTRDRDNVKQSTLLAALESAQTIEEARAVIREAYP